MTKQRKQQLLELLKESPSALNGQSLAEHFHVTRQIIVQDIALLRADGAPILSTNRGYLYKDHEESNAVHQLFKIQHRAEDMEAELLAIVDNGGRVQNILIEHPVCPAFSATSQRISIPPTVGADRWSSLSPNSS